MSDVYITSDSKNPARKRWVVTVITRAGPWSMDFATQAEARNFARQLVGSERNIKECLE